MVIVELKTAYHWHCDNCSAENFALPEKAELTDSQAESAYRVLNMMDCFEELPQHWRQFEMVCIPNIVTCSECGHQYLTSDERSVLE